MPLVSRAAERHGSGKDGSGDKDLLPKHNILHSVTVRGTTARPPLGRLSIA